MPDASSLFDIYYIMERMATLRPKFVQALFEACTSQRVKHLFLYMTEKAGNYWYKALKLENINRGTSKFMITPIGKYINKYNMIISKELAEYE